MPVVPVHRINLRQDRKYNDQKLLGTAARKRRDALDNTATNMIKTGRGKRRVARARRKSTTETTCRSRTAIEVRVPEEFRAACTCKFQCMALSLRQEIRRSRRRNSGDSSRDRRVRGLRHDRRSAAEGPDSAPSVLTTRVPATVVEGAIICPAQKLELHCGAQISKP